MGKASKRAVYRESDVCDIRSEGLTSIWSEYREASPSVKMLIDSESKRLLSAEQEAMEVLVKSDLECLRSAWKRLAKTDRDALRALQGELSQVLDATLVEMTSEERTICETAWRGYRDRISSHGRVRGELALAAAYAGLGATTDEEGERCWGDEIARMANQGVTDDGDAAKPTSEARTSEEQHALSPHAMQVFHSIVTRGSATFEEIAAVFGGKDVNGEELAKAAKDELLAQELIRLAGPKGFARTVKGAQLAACNEFKATVDGAIMYPG